MNILGLRDFARTTWDPRLIILDLRDDASQALDNRLVTWVRSQIPRSVREMTALVGLLCGRHVVVVHEDEATALRFCDVLRQGEVEVCALEGGVDGWRRALLAEHIDEYAEARVSVLYAPANGRRTYVAAAGGAAIAVDAVGCAGVLSDEAARLGTHIAAVVDTTERYDDDSARIAAELRVPHFSPHAPAPDEIALPAIPMRFGALAVIDQGRRLVVRGPRFEIGPAGIAAEAHGLRSA